jgi:transketolase
MISVAGGLALAGMRPIAHSYTPFLVERPFEQVKLDLAHQGVGAILVSIGASYDAPDNGRTHQAPEDVALLSSLPDWTSTSPAIRTRPRSSCARLPPRTATPTSASPPTRIASPCRSALPASISSGVARRRRCRRRPMLDRVVSATDDLDVTVLYATTVMPFDADTLRAELSGSAVVLVEPYLQGTSAPWVKRGIERPPAPLLSIGVRRMEHRHYGGPEQHDEAHGLDAASLRRRIGEFLRG